MGMVVRSNINAMNANRNLSKNNNQVAKAIEKLASGYAINRAADDASGLAISERMEAMIKQLEQAEKNITDGISVTNVADGALNEVSEMIIRIEELSIQAANGTYSEVEKELIKIEIQVLYDEMDRIFQSSNFNGIKLFDHDTTITDTSTDDAVGNQYVIGSENIIGPIDPTFMESSIMEGMSSTENFSMSDEVAGATATLTIDNYYLEDYTRMEGTSFKITTATGSTTTVTVSESDVTNAASVQEVFNNIASRISAISEIELNGNDVTFTLGSVTQTQTISLDGKNAVYSYGDGTIYNDATISSNTIKSLDTIDDIDNTVTATNEIWIDNKQIVSGTGVIPGSDLTSLSYTNYTVFGSTIDIGSLISNNSITTYEDLKTYINQEIQTIFNNLPTDAGATVEFNADGTLNIHIDDYTKLSSYTITKSVTSDAPVTPGTAAVVASAANISFSSPTTIQASSPEEEQISQITLPDSYTIPADTGIITIKVGTTSKTFYTADSPYSEYLPTSTSDVPVTADNVTKTINDWIISQYSSSSYDTDVSGNVITLTGTTVNSSFSVSSISSTSKTLKSATSSSTASSSSSLSTLSTSSYYREYSVEVDILNTLGDDFDVSKLSNSGFALYYNVYFEFSDGSDDFEQAYSSAKLIDISSATDTDSLLAIINNVFSSTSFSYISDVEASLNENGIIEFSFTKSHSTSMSSYFKDGYSATTGLFSEVGVFDDDSVASATASGGTSETQPQSTIDFSGYDESNITDLYGKGFRITCATCPGEYINILFSSGITLDEAFNPFEADGEEIYSYVIPLEGVTSGSEIVSLIMEQLNADVLTHTTELAVGDPDSTLVVLDKRIGDIYENDTGNLMQAQILAGVVTNFEYEIILEEVTGDSTESSSSTTNSGSVYAYDVDVHGIDIFTAYPENYDAYITIRLPHLNVDLFSFVPPNPILDTNEDCMNQVNLAKCAALTISRCRAWIGADRNRLEATLNNTMNSNEQITSANSTIKDTDMAKEMIEYTKMGILTQASQSMLAQSNAATQQILSLLG